MTTTTTEKKPSDVMRRRHVPKKPPESASVIGVTDSRIASCRVLGCAGMFVLVDPGVGSLVRFEGRRVTIVGRIVEEIHEPGHATRVILESASGERRRVLKRLVSLLEANEA